jgi:TusA-related sulfurtransferase
LPSFYTQHIGNPKEEEAQVNDVPLPSRQPSISPDAVLDMVTISVTTEASCAVLIPTIKANMRTLQGGQVLEVQVNDPTAREDIASWCRLTGHELLQITDLHPHRLRIFIRKSISALHS